MLFIEKDKNSHRFRADLIEKLINNKTLFFFDYKRDCNYLVHLAKEKKFPVAFKYPIPYHGNEELKAKAIFGVLHCFYRYYKYKRKEKTAENNNNQKGIVV